MLAVEIKPGALAVIRILEELRILVLAPIAAAPSTSISMAGVVPCGREARPSAARRLRGSAMALRRSGDAGGVAARRRQHIRPAPLTGRAAR